MSSLSRPIQLYITIKPVPAKGKAMGKAEVRLVQAEHDDVMGAAMALADLQAEVDRLLREAPEGADVVSVQVNALTAHATTVEAVRAARAPFAGVSCERGVHALAAVQAVVAAAVAEVVGAVTDDS